MTLLCIEATESLMLLKAFFVVILCAGLLSLVACGTSTNTANEGKGTNNNESKEVVTKQTELKR